MSDTAAATETLPETTYPPITRTDIVRYAGASGDFNPIHHDEFYAKESGLPSVMAHGMLSAGILGCYVTDQFGAGSVLRYRVRFRDRVWPGDELTAQGHVVSRDTHKGTADLEIALVNQHGKPVTTGTATVRT